LDGEIYTNYPALGGLCRWAGDHFELAKPEEQRRLDGVAQLTIGSIENGLNGWSRYPFGSGLEDSQFAAEVGGLFRVSIANVWRHGTPDSIVSIDVLRAEKPALQMGEFKAHQGRVSGAAYNHIFAR
jgi:hypothetical protein